MHANPLTIGRQTAPNTSHPLIMLYPTPAETTLVDTRDPNAVSASYLPKRERSRQELLCSEPYSTESPSTTPFPLRPEIRLHRFEPLLSRFYRKLCKHGQMVTWEVEVGETRHSQEIFGVDTAQQLS